MTDNLIIYKLDNVNVAIKILFKLIYCDSIQSKFTYKNSLKFNFNSFKILKENTPIIKSVVIINKEGVTKFDLLKKSNLVRKRRNATIEI